MKVITAPAFYNTGSAYATRVAQTVTFDGPINIQGGYANSGGAPYDGVVDAGGGGNWTTLQAGDDALDAGDYTMLVKGGTYSATLTVATDDAKIVVEPGTTITAAITLSGDNVTLVLGAGCDIQAVITMSGDNCSLICENGVDTDGLVMSGNFGYHDGGGWDTLHNGGTATHGIHISGTDGLVVNCATQTTGDGGGGGNGMYLAGARGTARNVKVPDSDNYAFNIESTGTDCLIEGCVILGADYSGVIVQGARSRIIGNYFIGPMGDRGIVIAATGDNSVLVGNIVQDQTGDSIEVDAAGEDCVIVGNRTDGAIDDNSGTSTVTGNDATAF